jgi:hypothetical protein
MHSVLSLPFHDRLQLLDGNHVLVAPHGLLCLN